MDQIDFTRGSITKSFCRFFFPMISAKGTWISKETILFGRWYIGSHNERRYRKVEHFITTGIFLYGHGYHRAGPGRPFPCRCRYRLFIKTMVLSQILKMMLLQECSIDYEIKESLMKIRIELNRQLYLQKVHGYQKKPYYLEDGILEAITDMNGYDVVLFYFAYPFRKIQTHILKQKLMPFDFPPVL